MLIDVKPEVRNLLLSNPDLVSALGGQKIFSVLATGTTSYPYITIQEIGNNGLDYADDLPERAQISFQVDIWSDGNYSTVASLVDATLSPTRWKPATDYTVNEFVSNGGVIYQCTTAGTSAASGVGPSGQSSSISDGTAVWKFVTSARYIREHSADLAQIEPIVFHKVLRYWTAREVS